MLNYIENLRRLDNINRIKININCNDIDKLITKGNYQIISDNNNFKYNIIVPKVFADSFPFPKWLSFLPLISNNIINKFYKNFLTFIYWSFSFRT